MSYPNILLIEPDVEFAEKLLQKFKPLGFTTILRTDIFDIDDLLKIPIPIHSIILNLEIQGTDGFALYSFLKEHKKFQSSTFTFLANNKNVFELLENMPLDRSLVLNKEIPFSELISRIINNFGFPQNSDVAFQFSLEITGNLSEMPFGNIQTYCKKTLFTGNLILTHNSEFAIIRYRYGDIVDILYKDLDRNSAQKVFNTWIEGNFCLERKRIYLSDMRNIIHDKVDKFKQEPPLHIDLHALLTDVFYFLYTFLSEQLPLNIVNKYFFNSIKLYRSKNLLQKRIEFDPLLDEKIILSPDISHEDKDVLIELIRYLLHSVQENYPEIDNGDFMSYLNEIEPYLREIDFYNSFLVDNSFRINHKMQGYQTQPILQKSYE